MNEIIIELKEVKKTFITGNERLEVLKGIDFVVKKGDFISILGPSGSGKSTLLHIIGGLEHPTSGDVLFFGENLYVKKEEEISKIRNKSIGFVFQFHHLLEDFTLLENVMLPLLINRIDFKEAKDKALSMIERFGLKERINHKPNQLSGGERQRAAIARAMINDPDILLFDEPTGNLDEENANIVIDIIRDLNKTILLVSHNDRLAKIAKDIYIIRKGVLERYEM